jgi:hypothetical protein
MVSKSSLSLVAVTLAASLALGVLLVFLAAVPCDIHNGADPHIEAITVTSSLPISDTHPGLGITKTVYFSNAMAGVITLTFDISGTPLLTLTAGAAFEQFERTYTSTSHEWNPVVTYSIATVHRDQPNIVYTVTNVNLDQATVVITYVRGIPARKALNYLPLVVYEYPYWDTYEPNDTRVQAYGPLVSGQAYTSYIYSAADRMDYYSTTITAPGNSIVVDLTVPACCDYDLYLYDSLTGNYVAAANYMGLGLDEHMVYTTPQVGVTYYILVYSPYRHHSRTTPYYLKPVFP